METLSLTPTAKVPLQKRPNHRPSKYRAEMVQDAFVFGGLGFTDVEIAKLWGVSHDSMLRWKRKHKEFGVSLERGRANANVSVSRQLYEQAKKGNMTAIIFWLTNRCPEVWADKRAVVNNQITNNVSQGVANGKFTGEDRELQLSIKRELDSLFQK